MSASSSETDKPSEVGSSSGDSFFKSGKAVHRTDACIICDRCPRLQCPRCQYRFCGTDCATLHKYPSQCTGVGVLPLYTFSHPVDGTPTRLINIETYTFGAAAFRFARATGVAKPVFELNKGWVEPERARGERVTTKQLTDLGISKKLLPKQDSDVFWDKDKRAMLWNIQWMYDVGGSFEKCVTQVWDDESLVKLHNRAIKETYMVTPDLIDDRDVFATIESELWEEDDQPYGGKVSLHAVESEPQNCWGHGRRRQFYFEMPAQSSGFGPDLRKSFLILDGARELGEFLPGQVVVGPLRVWVTHRLPHDLLNLNVDVFEVTDEGFIRKAQGTTRILSELSSPGQRLEDGFKLVTNITDDLGSFIQHLEAVHLGDQLRRADLSRTCDRLCDELRFFAKHLVKKPLDSLFDDVGLSIAAADINQIVVEGHENDAWDGPQVDYFWRKFRKNVRDAGIRYDVGVEFQTRKARRQHPYLEDISESLKGEIGRLSDALRELLP